MQSQGSFFVSESELDDQISVSYGSSNKQKNKKGYKKDSKLLKINEKSTKKKRGKNKLLRESSYQSLKGKKGAKKKLGKKQKLD